MNRIVAALCLGLSLCLILSGCFAPATPRAPERAAAPKPPAAAEEKTDLRSQIKVEQVKPAPPAQQLTLEEVQARRQIEKELERDVEEYYALLKDRNVEKALESTPTDKQELLQTQLWQFIAQYSIESSDIREKKIDFSVKPYKADVSLSLTVYEARSVTPKKIPAESRWVYGQGRWYILPK